MPHGAFAPLSSISPTSWSLGQSQMAGYIRAWGGLSLDQIRKNPFSVEQFSETIQEGIRSGLVTISAGIEQRAADIYVNRARLYEQSLLQGLGVDAPVSEALVKRDLSYEDYFVDGRYDWLDGSERAERIVSEMTRLTRAIDHSAAELEEWKKLLNTLLDSEHFVNVSEVLDKPLSTLQAMLIRRVEYAQRIERIYDLSTEEGLAAYFYRKSRRHSGIDLAGTSGAYAVYDSVLPPPAE